MTRLEQRAADVSGKIKFMRGKTNVHPHGKSGLRHILPVETTSNCWDTSREGYQHSEYGSAAGMTT